MHKQWNIISLDFPGLEINTGIKIPVKMTWDPGTEPLVSTPVSQHCQPACYIRLPHFAVAIKCRDLVSGIGYSTVPYFGPLGRFWYSSLTPFNY